MRTKVQFILFSGLVLLLRSCSHKEAQSEHDLLIYTAQATPIVQESNKEYPFIAQPFRTSELSFRVGGPIDRLDIYAGNRYKQGSIMAEIDPRDFRIRQERAQAIYNQAKTEFERIEVLYHKGNISASTYERAKAECVSTKMAYETAVNELADTQLKAPFNGYVGEVYVEKFQDVKPTEPVLSLIDIDQLKIEIYVTPKVAYAAQKLSTIRLQSLGELYYLKSENRAGLSKITVYVKKEIRADQMQQLWDKLRRKVNDVQSKLPAGAGASVVNDDFGDVLGVFYGLTGHGRTYRELEEQAKEIKNQLLKVKDVAKVEVYGTQTPTIDVAVSPSVMARSGRSTLVEHSSFF